VEVFVAGAAPRVVNSLEAYDLLEEVGGLPLVQLDVCEVFWAVLDEIEATRKEKEMEIYTHTHTYIDDGEEGEEGWGKEVEEGKVGME
jgi:hypothetical protein